jgi:predicted nucleic acid-binding protein
MINTFIDTSYICALYNPHDSLHKEALKLKRGIDQQINPFISNYIFLETVTVLSQRVGKQDANDIGNLMFSSNKFGFLQATPKIDVKTWQLFQKVSDKNISYVDCSNVVLMKEERIDKILTFDQDFEDLKKQANYNFEILS